MKEHYIDSILDGFLPTGGWTVTAGATGLNNTTRFIEAGGERYVLRIYETHGDEEKVRYEYSVLQGLQQKQLPFRTPEPVPTLQGGTLLRAEDGKLAALFRFIPGGTPALERETELHSYGQVVARLTQALAEVNVTEPPAYRPYYDIWHAHSRCRQPDVLSFCMSPPAAFADLKQELHSLARELQRLEDHVPQLKQLPHQLVHGDLNASNMLACQDGSISAILDFEFVTYDIRVMEPAVCLADFIRPGAADEEIWRRIPAFAKGYKSALHLAKEEAEVLPVLILLRSLDVFLHFLGRYWDGKNEAERVRNQIVQAAWRAEWLQGNGNRIVEAVLQ
nr:phosphotransferase [Ectobacillus ponti]